jgi:hypothetical protein
LHLRGLLEVLIGGKVISILVPTRGRPDGVRRLVTSARETADGVPQFVFYVDDDDPASQEVVVELECDLVVGPRIVLSEMWNRCWEYATFDVAMHCGDDIVFRSNAWDTHVVEAFDRYPDRIALVHGRDGFQHPTRGVATHSFLHRNWVETLGYFVPPYFSSDYNDTWLTELAETVGRRVYVEEIFTEHMHPIAGKGEWDQTHRERLVRHQRDRVDLRYAELASERNRDAEKLREFINQSR